MSLTASHKNASFDLLEQLSSQADPDAIVKHVIDAAPGVAGSILVSTCNRFELYVDVDDEHPDAVAGVTSAATSAIAEQCDVATDHLATTWHVTTEQGTAEHLFSVASGLESVVVGEGEIAGQVRRSLESARAAGTTTSALERLFQHASKTSRGVKNRTPLGQAGRSIVRLSLELASSRVTDWSTSRVLLVGTGAYAGASLAALRDRGVTDVSVYSTSGRGAKFAASHGIALVEHDELPTAIASSDIIVTCTLTEGYVLDADLLQRARIEYALDHAKAHTNDALHRDETPGCPVNHDAYQLVIDLGLPRNVNPDVGGVFGVELLDLETIRIHAPLEELQATDTARAIVTTAARNFTRAGAEESLSPAVVALRRRAHAILDEEIARVQRTDSDGTAAAALRHMMGRLLHTPTTRARDFARTGEHDRYLDALSVLFDIDVDGDVDAVARRAADDEAAS
ncbi:glutamyl-tRNA reductase [Microbacterium sp. MPKO10]|uniref:glutamyl-tRNA reductase n=1 Tax=Microbacterium sp. MPKO10 TaxID=2989818 RepID=UPI0022361880|nr:glutamyl-tRNA reductase [Microbacterium sp. MPKO10]MCW4457099.1 glutamyl-tRNA reductase [Microbacterium sp. MPKO10]